MEFEKKSKDKRIYQDIFITPLTFRLHIVHLMFSASFSLLIKLSEYTWVKFNSQYWKQNSKDTLHTTPQPDADNYIDKYTLLGFTT